MRSQVLWHEICVEYLVFRSRSVMTSMFSQLDFAPQLHNLTEAATKQRVHSSSDHFQTVVLQSRVVLVVIEDIVAV